MRVFPRVLFVVLDEKRREVITEVLSCVPEAARNLFVVTTTGEAVGRLAQWAAV
ncbi:hypothetical protein ACSNOI_22245 [Actinomadura kijaniata]|uniref:hypothetical protein n=1 Tax=Actinomadura kijaniata TaxID=46161 RepID=UPI003F1CF4BE